MRKEFGEHLSIPDYLALADALGFPSHGLMLPDQEGAFYLGSLIFERWGIAEHGKWRVALCCGAEALTFIGALSSGADAVMDDFGNLVRVQ